MPSLAKNCAPVLLPPKVKLPSTVRAPAILAFPQTSSLLEEVVAPIPTLPSTNSPSVGAEIPCLTDPIWALPATERLEFAVVIPIPKLPVEVMTVLFVPELTWNVWEGEVMPIPTLPEVFIYSPRLFVPVTSCRGVVESVINWATVPAKSSLLQLVLVASLWTTTDPGPTWRLLHLREVDPRA